jgi:hypothetical protein
LVIGPGAQHAVEEVSDCFYDCVCVGEGQGRPEPEGDIIRELDLRPKRVLGAFLTPGADREQRRPRCMAHGHMLQGRPLRPRDGPKIGDQRLKPFGWLDAELDHQQVLVSGELSKRLGGIALRDMHPDQGGSWALPKRLGPYCRERRGRSVTVLLLGGQAVREDL